MQLDSKTLPDEAYRLRVLAKTPDGRSNIAVLNHIIDNTGPSISTSVADELSGRVQLMQNYPNPFRQSTSIEYVLRSKTKVELSVYDLFGRKVMTLDKGIQIPGSYVSHWNRRDNQWQKVKPGYYIYQLKAADHYYTKKMLIVD